MSFEKLADIMFPDGKIFTELIEFSWGVIVFINWGDDIDDLVSIEWILSNFFNFCSISFIFPSFRNILFFSRFISNLCVVISFFIKLFSTSNISIFPSNSKFCFCNFSKLFFKFVILFDWDLICKVNSSFFDFKDFIFWFNTMFLKFNEDVD